MFRWKKQGKIFDPSNRYSWMKAYSQVPTLMDKGNAWRVYFTCRPPADDRGRFVSHTTYVDVAKAEPARILAIREEPILPLGSEGSFDEFGIHPTSVLQMREDVYLYYTGWTRGCSVPYTTWIGLAVSRDGGDHFEKMSQGPILGPNRHDAFLANGAYVFADGPRFRMVYASASKWVRENQKLEPVYTLKQAESQNGIDWTFADCENLLPSQEADECISRPSVLRLGDVYHMWYAYRSIKDYREGDNGYRIGYARASNFEDWERLDSEAGIDLSEAGWDSQMMAYPQVVQEHGWLLMFYNGNSFGKDGFGYATASLDEAPV